METVFTISNRNEVDGTSYAMSFTTHNKDDKRRGSAPQLSLSRKSLICSDTKSSKSDSNLSSRSKSKKVKHITSSLPLHLRKHNKQRSSATSSISPQDYLIFNLRSHGLDAKTQKCQEVQNFFMEPTPEQISGYDHEVTKAVRTGDMMKLREIHQSGKTLQCCNRFGESLIHMACRRGNSEMVRYLVQDANVSLRVRDDFGRTPLHDACWTAEPNFELVEFLIREEAGLLLMCDARGHAPFQYVRREHWTPWVDFLKSKGPIVRQNIGQ